MKKRHMQILITMFVLSASVFAYALHTKALDAPVSGAAGTVDDPLVTKSYVDEQIRLLKEVNNSTPQPTNPVTPGPSEQPTIIEVIKLESGQTLYGGAGAEFIVRTGKALVYTSDENGIADLTAGKDILNGEIIELNHLLLFPRDGRAIQAAPDHNGDIYVIVKGNFLLLDGQGNPVKVP